MRALAHSWPRESVIRFSLLFVFQGAQEGSADCLDTKRPKNQVSRKASLRSGPLPCKTSKTWAGMIFLVLFFYRCSRILRNFVPTPLAFAAKLPMSCCRTGHHRFANFRVNDKHWPAHGRGWPSYFCLIKSNLKSSQ